MNVNIFRVIVPVVNIDEAQRFYQKLIGIYGERGTWLYQIKTPGFRNQKSADNTSSIGRGNASIE